MQSRNFSTAARVPEFVGATTCLLDGPHSQDTTMKLNEPVGFTTLVQPGRQRNHRKDDRFARAHEIVEAGHAGLPLSPPVGTFLRKSLQRPLEELLWLLLESDRRHVDEDHKARTIRPASGLKGAPIDIVAQIGAGVAR